MKKVIRLTESDLIRLVKRVIKESDDWSPDDDNEIRNLHKKKVNIFKQGEKDKKIPYVKDYGFDDDSIDRFSQDFDKWKQDSGYKEASDRIDTLSKRRPKTKQHDITPSNRWEIIGQLQNKIKELEAEMPKFDVNSDEDNDSQFKKYRRWEIESGYKDLKNKLQRAINAEI